MEVALYIHIPFCLRRCAYCDFVTYSGKLHLRTAYVEALQKEMSFWAERFPSLQARTLYFGGGTPSLLAPAEVATLIDAVRGRFHLPLDAEITLEANPVTLTAGRAVALRQAGVNRLSLGVQSFNDAELRLLGRLHDAKEAVRAVKAARAGGFDNLSIDLIFGLPRQGLGSWRATLEQALVLKPQHLSLYALTVEAGTPLAARIAEGCLPAPDPDLAAEMYEVASTRLLAAGYWQYEISNWALGASSPHRLWQLPPGGRMEEAVRFASRHNLAYWRNMPWLGMGVAAHSWLDGRRWRNVESVEDYLAHLQRGESAVAETEIIPPSLERGETLMMGLRLAEGVDAEAFRARFGLSLRESFPQAIERFTALGLLEWRGRQLRLTARGRLLGNQVFAAFLPES